MTPGGYGRSRIYHPFEGNFDEWAFELHRVEPGANALEARYLLNDADIAFVLEHCRCFYCDRRFVAPLRECVCGKAFWAGCSGEIYASQPKAAGRLADRVFSRQKSRDGHARRTAFVKAAEGKPVTAADKALLYKVQEGLCYYCGEPICRRGPGKYHHDHFVPLALGGRLDLENAVLACPPCNTRKNSDNGAQFIARMRHEVKDAARLSKMRRTFGMWRLGQGFRPFADLPTGW